MNFSECLTGWPTERRDPQKETNPFWREFNCLLPLVYPATGRDVDIENLES